MKKYAALLCLLTVAACSGGASDPSKWTCDSLVQPVIEMSEERSPRILEITSPEERDRTYGPNPKIECRGSAEWSQGSGGIKYGAYVSDGGKIVLQYQQW